MKRKTIVIYTGGSRGGFLSIAQAISQTLTEDFAVHIYQEKDEKAYLPFYRLFPGLFKIPYLLSQNSQMLQLAETIFRSQYSTKQRQFFLKHQPDLCISTYFIATSNMTHIMKERQTPFINVLTDPKSIHPLLLAAHADINFVFDQKSVAAAQKFLPDGKFATVGWFVRDEFEQEYDKKIIRKQLQLNPDTLTFLIAAGSEGTNTVLSILPLLMTSLTPLQIVVACGKNRTMLKTVSILASTLRKLKSRVTLIPITFTNNMHLYMQAADLVVGKAGPNTVFESVATRTPFFAITHIAGQEDGNLDLIREYHLGYVEENPFLAAKLLKHIVKQPRNLKKFQPYLEKLGLYNREAKRHLRETVQTLV